VSQAPFIIGAYGVAFAALAGLVAFSLIDRRRVRREIAARGLERTKR
jgi:heme exporter protein CcmD